jgi:uncharacterized protein YuzE
MKITYSPDVDALYIYLGDPERSVERTQELEEGLAVEYAADGTVVGLEVLGASERLGFRRGAVEVSLEQAMSGQGGRRR